MGRNLNGVGSFTLDMLELDPRSIERSTIFVDDVEAALEEAGELVAAERAGLTARDQWTPLGAVAPWRRARTEPRGRDHALQVGGARGPGTWPAASRALARARELGLGLHRGPLSAGVTATDPNPQP